MGSNDRVYLRILTEGDVTQEYVKWMQDEEVMQFLESRWRTYSLDDLKEYVRMMNESPDNVILGVFMKSNSKHVGNVKIGNINQIHRFADIGILLGDKRIWGKGYGAEAIQKATAFAFEELNLNKLMAGIYKVNIGSFKAFEKAGYTTVGVMKKHRFFKGRYEDEYLVEKCKD